MPCYTLECDNGHSIEIMCKYDELEQHKVCGHLDCQKEMKQQFNMNNKPLVADRDLMLARNHNGKKY